MTYRVDTLKNMLRDTRGLLAELEQELDDLHVLAYDRPVAAEEARVSGGTRDYALDTHGDRDARDAFRHIGTTVVKICNMADYASQEALKLLRAGDTPNPRAKRTLRLVELGELIAYRAKRVTSGDYTSVRRGPQPDEGRAMQELREDRDHLQRQLARAEKEITKGEREIAQLKDRQRRRDGAA